MVFTLNGETGKSVSQYSRAWLELVPVVRSWLMAGGKLARDKARAVPVICLRRHTPAFCEGGCSAWTATSCSPPPPRPQLPSLRPA